jgi:peptidoglycan/LPS O-acetylase OafA/YrhL
VRYLGTISYGIYLWHLAEMLSIKRTGAFDGAQALPLVIMITLLLAAGSWHLFEKPLMITRKKIS